MLTHTQIQYKHAYTQTHAVHTDIHTTPFPTCPTPHMLTHKHTQHTHRYTHNTISYAPHSPHAYTQTHAIHTDTHTTPFPTCPTPHTLTHKRTKYTQIHTQHHFLRAPLPTRLHTNTRNTHRYTHNTTSYLSHSPHANTQTHEVHTDTHTTPLPTCPTPHTLQPPICCGHCRSLSRCSRRLRCSRLFVLHCVVLCESEVGVKSSNNQTQHTCLQGTSKRQAIDGQ